MEERLQKFVKLVDAGSFTKAALEMHISQPALTVAVAKLERELGTELLVRGSRPLTLTEAGQMAYRAGEAQAIALDNLRVDLGDLAKRRTEARVGMIDSVAAILSAYAQPLTELKNEADVSIIVNDSQYLRDAVAERKLDLAIVIDGDKQTSVTEKHIGDELMVLVASPTMRAAKQAELEQGRLTDFICYDQPSQTYDLVIDGLASQGIQVETRLQSSSPEVMSRMVISGNGVALLPYFIVRGLLVTKTLVAVEYNGAPMTLQRKLNLAFPTGKKQSKAVQSFIESITKVLQDSLAEAHSTVFTNKQKRYHD